VLCIQVNEFFLGNVPDQVNDGKGTNNGGSNGGVGEFIAKSLVLHHRSFRLHGLIFHTFVFVLARFGVNQGGFLFFKKIK
jgi:hypothetical protein